MTPAEDPAYAERQTYRRRRLGDAARLLPVLGAGLFGLPIFWQETPTTRALIYVFVAWAVLCLLSGLVAWRLRDEADDALGAPLGEAGDQKAERRT
ncbi:hypothetical protein ACM25N_06265 [Roseovarius sp. C7]|uniref:hypothetical protein n=1 Tax=Roseovarius sp. C7 TaxID=3398643 RepID=UPI0039F742AD